MSMNAIDVLKALGITIDLFDPNKSPADQIKVAKEKVLALALENSPYRDTYNFLINTEKLLGLSRSSSNQQSQDNIPIPRPNINNNNDAVFTPRNFGDPVLPPIVGDFTNIPQDQITPQSDSSKEDQPKDPEKKTFQPTPNKSRDRGYTVLDPKADTKIGVTR